MHCNWPSNQSGRGEHHMVSWRQEEIANMRQDIFLFSETGVRSSVRSPYVEMEIQMRGDVAVLLMSVTVGLP